MPVYVALLRAVNVGGTGKLAMADLKAVCDELGFAGAKTFIQSGNVVFRSDLPEPAVQAKLEQALAAKMGKAPGVLLRSRRQLDDIAAKAERFLDAKPNLLLITFLPEPPPADALDKLVAPDGEEVRIDGREIYVHYPNGSGRSKLKLPALRPGTARNLNTIRKLAEMAAAMEDGS
ncbi:DUF1697 domain-containing protein [Sinorhizobium meliloti]|uniref:DUF1697 domain-containing protein n=2 Tax=Rhizobium meliloti TaxID=382 RepID=F7WZY0_SINMM|nr:DUF1697 domain-containing protein [Sinorhizobium meliloti]PST28282.1 DUF1697 domain-containing protein [Mesorhizobium loti]TWB02577.1 uncharacterized protein (DUF1697 family) [Ensifer sp. SEMIA 134]TWB36735.1 uncharacterized protein (DUF1697 family) [Ensifer sp. SEMIA 135]AEG03536.1 protein of unknown function DUF1697 [Sinorhizobium meliloti BL225C]AEG52452.1 protein of unknown function DUF1697 [Sinorhizobium meliloti AK83]